MKKLTIILAIAATAFTSCTATRKNIIVTSGVPVPFKDIERSNVVLAEKPGQNDSIIITVVKH